MKKDLTGLKNILWAGSIVVCLLAVVVALFIAAFSPYKGPIVRGGPVLGGQAAEETPAPEDEALPIGTELIRVPESTDAGQGYIDSLQFLCDSSIIGLRDYALLADGLATTQVWGSNAGNIPSGDLANCKIRYPADGSEISPAEAAAKDRPARLIVVLGADGLADIDEDRFVNGYVDLIRAIQTASPDTAIVVCSISSVTTTYGGADGVNANVIRAVNSWIQKVCTVTGVYYCDTASAVNDRAGWLDSDYASANGKALNSAGIRKILDYLRCHAI